ncbi:MAG: alpha/beta fold hydrolase [Bdellovibrionaceae bacterium]|nr:alpha/beta fold hydrolase [Pseudobdellovibrionaceae bacterium]
MKSPQASFILAFSLSLSPLLSRAETAKSCESPSGSLPETVQSEKKRALRNKDTGAEVETQSVSAKINGQEIPVKYQKYPAPVRPAKGTILFLCGGPGFPCTEGGRPGHLPPEYDVVTLDYLGIGQNRAHNEPGQMSIDAQAQAVEAIARQIKAPHLVIYGHSFGTTVATAAASKLTNPAATPKVALKSVVLEGVVGHGGQEPYGRGHLQVAEEAWKMLTPKEQKDFTAAYKKYTAKMTASQKLDVDYYLTESLLGGPLEAIDALLSFATYPEDVPEKVQRTKDFLEKAKTSEGLRLYRAAGCQILGQAGAVPATKIMGGQVTLAVGQMPGEPGYCDCPLLSKLWDPSEYQIQGVPVLYINGHQDAATPYAWAETHLRSQTKASQKVMLAPELGGHSETMTGGMAYCTDEIFDRVFSGQLALLKTREKTLSRGRCSGRSQPASGQQ